MTLKVSEAMTAADLRSWARRCGDSRASTRAYAIANALEGMDRAEAARLAGLERQALRDAVIRYNAEGVSGLFNRPRGRRSEWLIPWLDDKDSSGHGRPRGGRAPCGAGGKGFGESRPPREGLGDRFRSPRFGMTESEQATLAAARHIILVRRERAGRLYLGRTDGEIRIIDIALLPAARGKATGTALIRAVQEGAAAQGCRLALSVIIGNPAERLYLRLGFYPRGDGNGRREMIWRPV